jgi:hypothetical protein
MHPYKFSLSLRVFHPSVTPEVIQAELGLKARIANSAGKNRVTASGKVLPTISSETYCSFLLAEGDDRILMTTIDEWSEILAKTREFLTELRSTGGRVEYFLGLFIDSNGGFGLDYEQMKSLGSTGIDLSLDIYNAAEAKSD